MRMSAWQHDRVRDRVRDLLAQQGGEPLADADIEGWIEELEESPWERIAQDTRRIRVALEGIAYIVVFLLIWLTYTRAWR
jgi:hypothetical protein